MTETVPKFTLKALRVNKKKTQQEIADYLEVNLRTYQKYEKDPDFTGRSCCSDYMRGSTCLGAV